MSYVKPINKPMKTIEMTKREAKIEALKIVSIVVNELEGSDAIIDNKVRIEINKIALSLAIRSDKLTKKTVVKIHEIDEIDEKGFGEEAGGY